MHCGRRVDSRKILQEMPTIICQGIINEASGEGSKNTDGVMHGTMTA